ncbi:MAG: TfoX/Sxy family protein [Dehalococcoidia bacterium]
MLHRSGLLNRHRIARARYIRGITDTTMPAKKNHPDTPIVEEIVARLAPFADVSARFMFGGWGLYAEGVMFGLVDEGAVYLRIDDLNRPAFEAAGQQQWTYDMKGKVSPMPYFSLPPDAYDDPDALRTWFDSARAAAARNAKPKKNR